MIQKAFAKMISLETPALPEKEVQRLFLEKVHPCMLLSQKLGNIYCGSLYSTLVSLLLNNPDIKDKNVLMFSYGSGLCSTLFKLRVH